jgi:hypothetical protein
MHIHTTQVVAYNKMDVPDSGDYWTDIRDELIGRGVPAEDVFGISAVSGRWGGGFLEEGGGEV